MKVQEIMTLSPEACYPHDNLAEAVEHLWKADCGALPVVDHAGHVAGILTDRDICIALGTRDTRASEIPVAAVMQTAVQTCLPTDELQPALARMSARRVRRLPVVDVDNRLVGMLSLGDAALAAGASRDGVRPAAVLETFKAVSAHPLPVLVPEDDHERAGVASSLVLP